ncbi:MAG: hypothetical protein COB26_02885 [Piscirickettsiaceae bacterium]|nr:MAG: hypothetical protein COB26_02885 [Piscirickettsiaceae bacterium]
MDCEQVESIAVIIPYYQKEAGILRATVKSALQQRGVNNYTIIVVDDDSPIPAEKEIADLVAENTGKLKIIHQANAGPGAARNKGIDSVEGGAKYIAFLDSDDVWMEGHLENALFALEQGYDFYFSDFYFADYKECSVFERAGKIKSEDHQCINEERAVYRYMGSMMDQILIKGNVIGTPTVVYRYQKYPDLRFREQFYNGQDYVFWLDFAQTGGSIVVSFLKECDCGVGLNIYAGAGWGTERSLERLSNELYLWSSVKKMYSLTPEQDASNAQKLASIREMVVKDIFHRLVNLKKIKLNVLKKLLVSEPSFVYTVPWGFVTIVKEKLFNRF